MVEKPHWYVLVAELSYFVTVILGVGAGYIFWKGNIAAKVPKDAEYGVASTYPLLALIVVGMVIVFLFTLRRILIKADILTKEESFKYLWSRSWYIK